MQPSASPAVQNILDLNKTTLEIGGQTLPLFSDKLLTRVPVISAMFSGAGGTLILHRPGNQRREAPNVPIRYQLLKSIGHIPVGIGEVVQAGIEHPGFAWQEWFKTLRQLLKKALSSLDRLVAAKHLTATDQPDAAAILRASLTYVQACLASKQLSYSALEAYARSVAPNLNAGIHGAAQLQVAHWMEVLSGWRDELGDAWSQAYGVVTATKVTRRYNILFCILAQFMGEAAIGDRLFLVETTDIHLTPTQLLHTFAKVISGRELGQTFFNQYYLMGNELLGGAGRRAIVDETAKRGMTAVLPPLVPVLTNAWPWETTPAKDGGVATLDDAMQRL